MVQPLWKVAWLFLIHTHSLCGAAGLSHSHRDGTQRLRHPLSVTSDARSGEQAVARQREDGRECQTRPTKLNATCSREGAPRRRLAVRPRRHRVSDTGEQQDGRGGGGEPSGAHACSRQDCARVKLVKLQD